MCFEAESLIWVKQTQGFMFSGVIFSKVSICWACPVIGGIAPNQVIARSEFEVHLEIYTEWM